MRVQTENHILIKFLRIECLSFITNALLFNSKMFKFTLFYWIFLVSIFNVSGSELRVKGPPSIVIQTKNSRTVPGNQSLIQINAPLILWCQGVHVNTRQVIPATEIIFIHNNKEYPTKFTDHKKHNATLTLDIVHTNDAGIWTCYVKTENYGNSYGDISIYLRPIVNTSLRLDEKSTSRYHFDLSSKTVVNGENVLLNCPVYGFPKPSIEWKKNGVRFDSHRTNILQNGDIIIKNITYEDDGIYTCIARNSFKHKSQNHNSDLKLDRRLRVKGKYAWILPLSIIILNMILLITIIIFCRFRQERKLLEAEDE